MKLLLAILALMFLAAAAPPVVSGSVHLCAMPAGSGCKPVRLDEVTTGATQATLLREVKVSGEALPLVQPLMVRIVAMASSEVRWNGVVLGRNGVPGPSASQEEPGRFVATFTVPTQLVRPGVNLVSVRLSAHHAWLPVKPMIRVFYIGPYQNQELRGLWLYLPALLVMGVLVAACVYLSASAASNWRDQGLRLLALIGGIAVLQLVLEVSRAFIAYTYPWYLARLAGVAVLAAVTAVLIGAYAAHRFAPAWRKSLIVGVAGAATLSILFVPWYEFKALGAILVGAAGLAVCSWQGLRRQQREAWVGLATSSAVAALILWQGAAFLERAYYVLLAALLMVLSAEQVRNSRRIRLERDAETERAAALAERLSRAEREGEPIVALKTGSQVHRVAESDILYVQAADDYCDVVLASGRRLLVTMSLAHFLATMPPRFVRVHKSYGVNRAHVTGAKAKPGGGRNLILDHQTTVPVGRSYGAAVASWLG